MAGERFLASDRYEIAAIADPALAPGCRGLPVPTRRVPISWFASPLSDPMLKMAANELGSVRNMDASHAKAVLGWAPRPAEESIVDAARSLIDLGIVAP